MEEKIQLTLNSEQKSTEAFLDSTPTLQSTVKKAESNYSAGTIDESMLSEKEKKMVEQFASEIDIENVDQIVNYGLKAQTNISEFSAAVLKKVKTHDLGEVGNSLKELTVALDATTKPEKKGILGIFQKAKRGIGTIRANYARAESNVDRIEKDLVKHRDILGQDISMYQQMYELNMQYYKELTMYIIAGKKALDQAQNTKLKQLKENAEKSDKQEDAQVYRDYEDLCHRFEKKLSDLELTRVISIQSAPQVRMLQNNDRELLDKLQSSLANTIPLWRNQLVLSLGIEHTSRALAAQGALSEKTNELLRKNSETLKMATVETAKQSEKSIVDIDTLKQCNRDLIASINEVIKIHEQGKVQRVKAQEELVKIEEELKQAMLEAGKNRK
ncbi:toxic anion resistance protein [Oliverpabstia intestinalis]|uniref:toxic anion resistance protein n=1 Tax=Oliverpabstia intestinalis TaxID=2606633 RepID=UPI003F8881A8